MGIEKSENIKCVGVPNAGRPVPGRGDQPKTLGMPCQSLNAIRMAIERSEKFAGFYVPDTNDAIFARGGQASAFGTETERADGPVVALQFANQLAGPGIPKANYPFIVPRGQQGGFRPKRHCRYPGWGLNGGDHFPFGNSPNGDFVIAGD